MGCVGEHPAEGSPGANDLHPSAGFRTIEQGTASQTLAAASPLIDGVTGRFFGDSTAALVSDEDPLGLATFAADEDAAARLWTLTLRALSL